MASDGEKIKTNPTPKAEVPAKDKSTSGVDTSKAEVPAKDKSTSDTSKAEAGKTADVPPSGYSRGEGQKPVSQAYKDNWNAIFGKKKKR